NKNQVHVHGVGEIHFSSKFLDPQYYKDKGMTEAMFLDIGEEEKLVRMGDLGKLLPDQSIQLMGRKDSQVKINGNRVNLNEIESCLNTDESIEQSVLVPVKNDNSEISLVAFITAFEDKPDLEKIKNSLREKLPEYMIPSFFVKVEKFPITASGKIDRNSLPRISYKDLVNSRKKVESVEKSDLQKRILVIWQKVFEKEDITVHDNFFQLGGNSLMATEIVNEIHSSFNMEVELSTVFDYQSVFEMAMFLENAKSEQVA
ncbi:MAG: non-ribosomal peptide synthetase, partial [Cytophagales bacterium]|nr:non-ribosomal peptide synthetase [Cytophagales bacterium]